MNHSQRNLKKLIRAKEDSIADEELFLSAAYQKYQTSLARAVTGRYRYGLQVLLDWDISEQAGVAYTDNYIRYISTQRTRSPSLSPPVSYVPRA